jgi:hypothetical protein
MTRAHTNGTAGGTAGREAGQDAGRVNGPRSAAIRWKVGSAAGRRAFGVESDRIALELSVRESADGEWAGLVRVVGEGKGEGAVTKNLGERPVTVRWQPDPELGLLHIDAEGFVRATIDTTNGTPRLLYARSGVLGELGLGGGRYEPEGTDLDGAA